MLLDIDSWVEKTLIDGQKLSEITSPSLKLKNGIYDSKGLYSTEIFGQYGSRSWRNMFAYIKLSHPVLHPAIYNIINRRVSVLLHWINMKIGITQNEYGRYIITKNRKNFKYYGIIDLYENTSLVIDTLINEKMISTETAQKICKLIKNDKKIFVNYVIVSPPLYRPADEDNKPYQRIIDENAISFSSINSSDKTIKNRSLLSIQNSYNVLYDSLVNKIKGKKGIIRGSLVSKTVDFSARAVIVGDPAIYPDEIGIPKDMLARLFYPWVINNILSDRKKIDFLKEKGIGINIPSLINLINVRFFEEKLDDDLIKFIEDVTNEVIKDKVVIAKRDPALHKLSVRSYRPVPIDDSTFHISPMVCGGHNADFDGDQMGVFVPLTEEAQKEAREKMLTINNINHPGSGLSLELGNDFILGAYILTREYNDKLNPKELSSGVDLIEYCLSTNDDYSIPIKYRGKINSLGRRCIENILEDKLKLDYVLNKKSFAKMFENFSDNPKWLVDKMYKIQNLTMEIASVYGGTMSANDFVLDKDLLNKRDTVLNNADKYDVQTELENITDEFMTRKQKENQYAAMLVKSGARGSAGNVMQMSVAKGYISDVEGKIIPTPIKSSFVEGFKPTDYFLSAFGSRKGVVDRSQNTAKSGYLSRQLVYLMSTVKAGDTNFCGTKNTFDIVLTKDNISSLEHRILKNGDTLTKEYAEKYKLFDKEISLYSPLYCKSKTLCKKCYPDKIRKRLNGITNVGVVSAQIVGERGTQLTMKTFHCFHPATYISVKENDLLYNITLEDFYNKFIIPEKNIDGQFEKNIISNNIEVWDNGKWTKINKIIKHKKDENSNMVMVRTQNNNFVVCQDNHPLMVREKGSQNYFKMEPKNIKPKEYILDYSEYNNSECVDNFITHIKNVDYDGDVYDLETESHTLSANGLYCHNTGGAASVIYLSDEDPRIINLIKQTDLSLVAKKDIEIILKNTTPISATSLLTRKFVINSGDESYEFDITPNIEFDISNSENVQVVDSKTTSVKYSAGDSVGEIESKASDVTNAVETLQSVLNHSADFETMENLVQELYETFKVATNIQYLHLEMIVSQLARDADHPEFPWRLGSRSKPPLMVGIKRVAGIENPIRGLIFEHFNDVVINSILSGESSKNRLESDYEKIFKF